LIQRHLIVFVSFSILLFSGLTYFPIKQSSAQLQPSTPTTPAQAGQSQLQPQQPSQFQDRIETGREPSLLPSAQPPTPQAAVAPPTSSQQRLQVSFISIRINNDHDPNVVGQNDGEWKIGVLVNGQFRDLSAPGSPLGDARGGTTYSLSNIQPVVLNVDKSKGALVVSTIGQEIDGCNFNFKIPSSVIQAGTALLALKTGGVAGAAGTILSPSGTGGVAGTGNASAAAGGASTTLPYYATQLKSVQSGINRICNIFNANDAIGTISDTYGPPTFGVGVHSRISTPVSDSGRDFVLTYQIRTLQVPQQPVQSQQAQ
jgi:hypothetical protein